LLTLTITGSLDSLKIPSAPELENVCLVAAAFKMHDFGLIDGLAASQAIIRMFSQGKWSFVFGLWPTSRPGGDWIPDGWHRAINKQTIPFFYFIRTFTIMPVKKRRISNHVTNDGYSYLTKRLLVSKAKSAGTAAAQDAMDLMGFVVTVKDGWVVKQYADGKTEQLQEI